MSTCSAKRLEGTVSMRKETKSQTDTVRGNKSSGWGGMRRTPCLDDICCLFFFHTFEKWHFCSLSFCLLYLCHYIKHGFWLKTSGELFWFIHFSKRFPKPTGRWKFVKPQKTIWSCNLCWSTTLNKSGVTWFSNNNKWHDNLFIA